MIFSEIYSRYYQAVAQILDKAMEPGVSQTELKRIVEQQAFGESMLTILPNLRSGKWPLLQKNGKPILTHSPERPMTTLEKRWLRSLLDDPRIRLFGIDLPELADVAPLFHASDYHIYDQYRDGDPYEDPVYRENFQCLLKAIRERAFVEVKLDSHSGSEMVYRFYPKTLEYSLKDDKFRVLTLNSRLHCFRLSSLKSCRICEEPKHPWLIPREPALKTVTLEITDRRNAMERAMLHFSHFQKEAVRLDEIHYRLSVTYRQEDEAELLIRVLAFGPLIRVTAPDAFIYKIQERLNSQKSCEL